MEHRKHNLLSIVLIGTFLLFAYGCSGGGGSSSGNAHAATPTVFDEGVLKDVEIFSGATSSREFTEYSGPITVDGNTITLKPEGGKAHVFVNCQMWVDER
jgi:hypothetical protein